MRVNAIFIATLAFVLGLAQGTTLPLFTVRGGAKAPAAVAVAVPQNEGALKIFINTIQESRKDLLAAGIARCISIFTMFPCDTIKTRLQMGQPNAFSPAGLYSGVGGSLFGQVPYGVLTFGSYEIYKKKLLAKFPDVKPAFVYALAAILGDITGSGWVCPSEVVKQQMQAGMYSTTGEAIKGIAKKKGLTGFYQGYFGGLSRDVPFRVSQLVSFELTKNVYIRVKAKNSDENSDINLSPIESAICGAVSGSISAALTTPMDRIKTLLMTDSSAYGGSVASCVSKIVKDEGMRGLTVGMLPRVIYIAPSVAIFFVAYEQAQQRL